MSDSDRETILARVRSALRRQPAASTDDAAARRAAPAASDAQTVETAPGLLQAFGRAAEDAQANVAVVDNHEAARRRLQEILRAEGVRRVIVSPDAAAPPWSCGSALAATGVRAVTRSASQNDRSELLAADAGVTVAAYGIADTGTLVLCASPGDHRLDSLAPPIHVALVRASALVPDLDAAFARLAADDRFVRHSAITFIRGPSRTADIELTLTIGVHGPGKVYVIVCEDVRMSEFEDLRI